MKSSSIVLTIHDKAFLLPRSLQALKEYTNWSHTNIIFVLDGCTDTSRDVVLQFMHENNASIACTFIETPDLYETKANNIGCKASKADYVIIIQDDQVISEPDWNTRILLPFQKWDDVFAVSGNCAHSWSHNPATVGIDKEGWSDLLIHHSHANKTNTDRNTFAIRESCNRGPLAIDRALLEQLNYFDEEFAPLSDDDHDLNYRAKALNKVCGYIDISWYSENHWGGTRDENGKTKQWVLDVNVKNAQLLYNRHKDLMNTGIIENRTL